MILDWLESALRPRSRPGSAAIRTAVGQLERDAAQIGGRLLGRRRPPTRFSAPPGPLAAQTEPVGANAGGAHAPSAPTTPSDFGGRVTVRRADGSAHTFTVRPRETILAGAGREKVALAFSCAAGGCGTCKVRVVRGDIHLKEPNCLSSEERAEGFALVCVGRPRGDVEIFSP